MVQPNKRKLEIKPRKGSKAPAPRPMVVHEGFRPQLVPAPGCRIFVDGSRGYQAYYGEYLVLRVIPADTAVQGLVAGTWRLASKYWRLEARKVGSRKEVLHLLTMDRNFDFSLPWDIKELPHPDWIFV